MRVLDLFSGAGGGILGGVLLGWRCVGAVEIDDYCCRVLRQRQLDGCLERFPIWNMDIRQFNTDVAPSYTGMVDIVAGGFPCEDISSAGRKAGIGGKRSGLWKEMAKTVRVVRPRYLFVENSPEIIHRGLGVVLGDLAEMGYDAHWGCVSAAFVGAPHIRDRWWLYGYAYSSSQSAVPVDDEACGVQAIYPHAGCRQHPSVLPVGRDRRINQPTAGNGAWKDVDSPLGMAVVDGLASRMDELRCLGRGQVPLVAATAFRILAGDVQ